MELLKKMADVMESAYRIFLAIHNENLILLITFRKTPCYLLLNKSISKIRGRVLWQFMTIVEILGGDVLPDALKLTCSSFQTTSKPIPNH